jgi:hypothetical protein
LEFTGEVVDVKRARLDAFVKELAQEGVRADAVPDALQQAEARVARVFDDMAQVFQPRDRLLATQGQVPVYYWLVRDVGPSDRLRDFITDFEWRREANRKIIAEMGTQGPMIDLELLRYDQFNRSVNDQHSLRGRYEILSSRYDRGMRERQEVALPS